MLQIQTSNNIKTYSICLDYNCTLSAPHRCLDKTQWLAHLYSSNLWGADSQNIQAIHPSSGATLSSFRKSIPGVTAVSPGCSFCITGAALGCVHWSCVSRTRFCVIVATSCESTDTSNTSNTAFKGLPTRILGCKAWTASGGFCASFRFGNTAKTKRVLDSKTLLFAAEGQANAVQM